MVGFQEHLELRSNDAFFSMPIYVVIYANTWNTQTSCLAHYSVNLWGMKLA